jgi:predicted dehydrogenase
MYSVLLIGAGRSGALFEKDSLRVKPASHLGAILKFKNRLKLIGVCDIDKSVKKDIKDTVGEIDFYTDYKQALKSLKPDIAVISTWTNTHKDIFIEAINSGVKGVILEKPVAKNTEEGEKMLSVWKTRKIPVIVNHERRWDRKYIIAKKLIKEGYIGEIKTVYGKVLLGDIPENYEKQVLEIEGGGPLIHDGTHLIDLFYYFFEELEIKDINIKKGKFIEKAVIGFLMAQHKIPIFFEIGGERDYFHFIIEIEGTKGVIKVGNGIKELSVSKNSKSYSGFRELFPEKFPIEMEKAIPGFAGPYIEILNSLDNNKSPNSSLYEGIKTLNFIYEIYNFGKGKGII